MRHKPARGLADTPKYEAESKNRVTSEIETGDWRLRPLVDVEWIIQK
ncbi:MAG: hypothetical protein ACTSUE_27610 [Promethearchaeota archaeon]